MIARAKRVFPGMVMSLLLSAPALAAAPVTEKAEQVPHRPANAGHGHVAQSSSRKQGRSVDGAGHAARSSSLRQAAAFKSPIGKIAVSPSRAADNAAAVKTVPAAKFAAGVGAKAKAIAVNRPMIRAAPMNGGILIRRTSSHVSAHQLIDDGTLWREKGAVTTWQQTGIASWYGGARWQGHKMSSGARYDENQLTAAHATLPIGTRVRVVRHDSPRFVIVTITDRPGTRTRIIDLSRKAAEELGILNRGIAMVTLQPI